MDVVMILSIIGLICAIALIIAHFQIVRTYEELLDFARKLLNEEERKKNSLKKNVDKLAEAVAKKADYREKLERLIQQNGVLRVKSGQLMSLDKALKGTTLKQFVVDNYTE